MAALSVYMTSRLFVHPSPVTRRFVLILVFLSGAYMPAESLGGHDHDHDRTPYSPLRRQPPVTYSTLSTPLPRLPYPRRYRPQHPTRPVPATAGGVRCRQRRKAQRRKAPPNNSQVSQAETCGWRPSRRACGVCWWCWTSRQRTAAAPHGCRGVGRCQGCRG